MSDGSWQIVCYDVRNPKRLRRCARLMEGHGERIQKSVFRCWLTKSDARRLRHELTQVLEREDDVLFIPVCARCAARVAKAYSQEEPWKAEPDSHTIL